MSIISAEVAKRLNAAVDERQSQLGGGGKRFPRGVHIVLLNDVKAEEIKKGNNAGMDQLTLTWSDPEGEHDDVRQVFTYGDETKSWAQVNQARMVEVLKRGFGEGIKPAKNVEDVANQFRKFKGQKVKAAMRSKQNLWRVMDKKTGNPAMRKDGHPDWRITEFPDIWYVGPIEEDLNINDAKAVIELGAADALAWNDYVAKYGEKSGDTPSQPAAANGAADGEDLNFENDAPPAETKAAPVKAAAPAATAPKDAVDDIDFE